MSEPSRWVRRAGSGTGGWDPCIRPGEPGWSHTGLYAADLPAGRSRTVETGDCEFVVLPLSGSFSVGCADGWSVELAGRAGVFDGPTDCAYVPRGSRLTVTARTAGRVALPFARARRRLAAAYLGAGQVPVELRGAGSCSREVRNFGTPGVLEADSLIACEVVTPAGNWSSYPPHKHDVERPGVETELEEIYYFEVAAAGGRGPDPVGYHRVYGTSQRPIDVLAEVRSGDVVLVPHGWHGPAMAPPGYDLYYLNVMAGPGPARAWLICDDPAHAWVRDTWADQPVDPRLPCPLTRPTEVHP